MPDKPLKYREMRRLVGRFGVEEDASRGKGSHRMLWKLINARVVRYPVLCHSEGDELSRAVIRAIRRRFKLTEDHGVSDVEFYGE